jgi:hypothetical protein
VACLLAAAGCSPPSELAVDRETFIDVYVELRMAALDRDDATITEAERDEILNLDPQARPQADSTG